MGLWGPGNNAFHPLYFLTKRSVYIVLADNRKEDTDFFYWFNTVELFGGDSPVFIVLNEKFQYKKYVFEEILNTFEHITKVVNINLADNTGVADLARVLQKHISSLPHVETEPIPKKWAAIRAALESMNKDYLHLEEYLKICNNHGIQEEEKAFFISAFLHDIGEVLHFQEDPFLRNCIILNPHWATEAVYLILFDTTIISKAGEFDAADIQRIWQGKEYKYKQADLLRLMINFELCYEIKDTGNYIVPELLSERVPQSGYPGGCGSR